MESESQNILEDRVLLELISSSVLSSTTAVREAAGAGRMEDIAIVLLGATGGGKSSTGNTLLFQVDCFESAEGQNAVTERSVAHSTDIYLTGDILTVLTVVDTPGLGDAPRFNADKMTRFMQIDDELNALDITDIEGRRRLQEERENIRAERKKSDAGYDKLRNEQVQDCIKVAQENGVTGVAAFFLVMNWRSRVTTTTLQSLEKLKELFGGCTFYEHVFVVFTHGDQLHGDVVDYLHPDVKQLLAKVKNRYFVVDNTLLQTEERYGELNNWRKNVLTQVRDHLRGRYPFTSINFITPRMKDLLLARISAEFETFVVCKDALIGELQREKSFWEKRGTSVVQLAGAGTSLTVGLTLSAIGIALAPVTFGAGLILTGIGTGVCVLGGVVSSGASIAQLIKDKRSNATINAFFESALRLAETIDIGQRRFALFQAQLCTTVFGTETDAPPQQGATKRAEHIKDSTAARSVATAAYVSFSTAAKVMLITDTVALKVAAPAAKAAVRAVPIVGLVLGGVADVITIGQSVYELSKGIRGKENDGEIMNKCNHKFEKIKQMLVQFERDVKEFCATPDKWIEENWCCSICLKPWKDPVICPATRVHIVGCRSCMKEWLKVSSTCPLCNLEWTETV